MTTSTALPSGPASTDTGDGVRIERVIGEVDRGTLFDIVADVERYPEFLPGWRSARIMRREGNAYDTDQSVSISPLVIGFSSRTVLFRPERIEVSAGRPWFKRFELFWRFDPLPAPGCRVSLTASIELRSRLLQGLVERVIPDIVEDTVSAFEQRVRQLTIVQNGRNGGKRP